MTCWQSSNMWDCMDSSMSEQSRLFTPSRRRPPGACCVCVSRSKWRSSCDFTVWQDRCLSFETWFLCGEIAGQNIPEPKRVCFSGCGAWIWLKRGGVDPVSGMCLFSDLTPHDHPIAPTAKVGKMTLAARILFVNEIILLPQTLNSPRCRRVSSKSFSIAAELVLPLLKFFQAAG